MTTSSIFQPANVIIVGSDSNAIGTSTNPFYTLSNKTQLSYSLAPLGTAGKFVLSNAWTLVVANTSTINGLNIAPIVGSTNYDTEWTSVVANATAPTLITYPSGIPVLGGEDFQAGVPKGDIYCKSNSGETIIVMVGV